MTARENTRAAISLLLDAGETPTAISKTLNVARATVYRIKKNWSGPRCPQHKTEKEDDFNSPCVGRPPEEDPVRADKVPLSGG